MERRPPWHPFRHPGFCGLRGSVCCITLLTLIILFPILWIERQSLTGVTAQNTTLVFNKTSHTAPRPHARVKRKRTPFKGQPSYTKLKQALNNLQPIALNSDAETPKTNLWYDALHLFARKAGINEACYVCALSPSTLSDAIPLYPVPLTANETAAALHALSDPTSPIVPDTTLPTGFPNFTGMLIRAHNGTTLHSKDGSSYDPVMTFNLGHHPFFNPHVCFSRACRRQSLFKGVSLNCSMTVNATCGTAPASNISECLLPQQWNTGNTLLFSTLNETVPWPSDLGAGALRHHVWVCGNRVYISLPPTWCGVCSLAELHPMVTVYSKLAHFGHQYPHYYPRTKRAVELRISPGEKALSGIIPTWGTINNAHNIDRLAFDLEELTHLAQQGFHMLPPVLTAMRTVILQHQMALDYLLASQGGLCHLIGQQCCTFIPDISDNVTHVVDHLNTLLHDMKDRDAALGKGWDFWSWLTSGSWRTWLVHIGIMVGGAFLCLMICSCCVLPFIHRLISSLITTTMVRYTPLTPLPVPTPPSPPSYYSSADDSSSDEMSV